MRVLRQLAHPIRFQEAILRKAFSTLNSGAVVYAAFPKSASQHLVNLLKIAFEDRIRVVTPKTAAGYGHNFISEKELHAHLLHCRKRLILYGHIPFNEHNNFIIEQLGQNTKIIVSIRPLPDIVVSYKEHIDRGFYGPLDYRINRLPESNAEWAHFDDEKKYDYIIQYIIPWYVRFLVVWMEGAKKWPTRFVTFEEHCFFPFEFLVNISRFLKLEVDIEALKSKIDPGKLSKSNFNVGKTGRGFKLLTDKQLHALETLLTYFGDSFLKSSQAKYVLYGYEGLPFDVTDVIKSGGIGSVRP